MSSNSTICIGDELFSVLADLRALGCDVWAWDAAVGCSAGYRVNFSERVADNAGGVKTAVEAGEHEANVPAIRRNPEGRTRYAGASPAALTIRPDVGLKQNQSTKQRRSPGNSGNAGEVGTLKQTSHSGDPGEWRHMPNNCVTAGETALSLETRLQQLYEKVKQSGRVRTRFKASTSPEDARLPHADD